MLIVAQKGNNLRLIVFSRNVGGKIWERFIGG